MITIVLYIYLLLTSAAPVLRPQKEPASLTTQRRLHSKIDGVKSAAH